MKATDESGNAISTRVSGSSRGPAAMSSSLGEMENKVMANQAVIPPPSSLNFGGPNLLIPGFADQSLWHSLADNLRDFFFPEKLPAWQPTSRPVAVRGIWGEYDNKKVASGLTIVLHILAIGALIAVSMLPAKVAQAVKPEEHVQLVAPDISEYMPMMKKEQPAMGGGGGGGERNVIQAPKGKLPKVTLQEQITPPTVVIRNDHPKLAVDPTITMQQDIKIASNMPTIGDPKSAIVGPASNGTGSGGGIGSGTGGGIGSGSGSGLGAGRGGNYGGGVMRVGGGVSAPVPIFQQDPEYSDEARKVKYQGTVTVNIIVGMDGLVRQARVQNPIGLGLDQKAVEAAKQWKFKPAMKDGKPVAVMAAIEVNFRLY